VIIVGSIVVLVLFLVTGWAIATEMFQQRSWRRRVESGDEGIARALVEEALAAWSRARPPRGTPASLWAGVQGVQLVSATSEAAIVSASAEGEFRTEGGRRVQVSSALEEAMALAARLVDMLLYDVPNLRLSEVRVDVYSTFTGSDDTPVQKPILTTTALRADADEVAWEAMSPAEVLGRFDTRYERGTAGQAVPIELELSPDAGAA
jgi:hypothetical protein